MDQAAIIRLLRKRCEGSTQSAVAHELGISAAYLADLLAGNRTPGDKVLSALGLTRHTVYGSKRR